MDSLPANPLGQSEQSCWNRFIHQANPKNWNITSDKVTRYAAIVFAICIVTMAVSGFMVTYPHAAGAFFTILALAAAASLIVVIIGLVKYCKQNQGQRIEIEINTRR